jgi:hypothetical protein
MSASLASPLEIRRVVTRSERKSFVELAYRINRDDPAWVPPLRSEVTGLITPGRNPWFEHGEAAFFLAWRGGRPVGRISAQIDALVLQHMGDGIGQWGMFEAEDAEIAAALLVTAEDWLRSKGMTRSMGPFSIGIWDEPGLLVKGHDHPPMVMMGHNQARYEAWIEQAGYEGIKDLLTYSVDVDEPFPSIVQRIVASGEKNARIRIRKVDMARFEEEAATILAILNDAWSDNWGFIPLTEAEIAFAGKKLKPIIIDEIVRIAELDGEPVAFMLTLPNLNIILRDLNGSLFPFGWARLMWRLRQRRFTEARVALMGVVKKLQSSRLASQLAFMLIEYIRRSGVEKLGLKRGEIGWVLDDNQGMLAIAQAIEADNNRIYRIYEKPLRRE